MNSTMEGGCLCGGLRYRLRERPSQIEDCHCVDCRRASGAPFVTWGSVKKVALATLQGQLRQVRHAGRVRSFASCCGTPLFFQDHEAAEWIDVAIASLDHPNTCPPEVAIWTEDRLPWVILDPEKPAFAQKRDDNG